MKNLQPYVHIRNFLYRFTILQIGSLHIRIHKIVDKDRSTLLHTHPFNYISVILKGGYVESVLNSETKLVEVFSRGWLNIIKHDNTVYHRIDSLKGNTYTLFIAYGKFQWKIININASSIDNGLYERMISNKRVWCRKENGVWFIGNTDKEIAGNETRFSIHQVQEPIKI